MHIPSHTLKCSNTQISASESFLFPDPCLRNDKNLLVVVTVTGNSINMYTLRYYCMHIYNIDICINKYDIDIWWYIHVRIAITRGTLQLLSINPRPTNWVLPARRDPLVASGSARSCLGQVFAGREQGLVYYQPKHPSKWPYICIVSSPQNKYIHII